MEKINEKWKRKRLINITYLIKRVLSEYDEKRSDKIQLHLSEKILKFYDEWYNNFQKTSIILYKICIKLEQNLNYTFMKKPIQYSCHKSKNIRFDSCIKNINMRSSFFMPFPKGFKSMMEDQMIFQNRRIRDEKKISVIHQSHNFMQSYIFSEV